MSSLHATALFGGQSAFDGGPPPAGDGTITGRVLFDGKPAEGVALTLYLNEQYRTEPVRTDAEGVYRVAVPLGSWRVNSVMATNWTNKPPGNFVMVSGREPPLESGKFLGRVSLNERALKLEVASGQPAVLPDLELRPTLNLEWPRRDRETASWADDAVQWEAYPGAESYVVEFFHVTREGNTTRYWPVLSRTVSGPRLALSELPAVPAEAAATEYSVDIRAFDAQGRFLSESAKFTATFTVDDRMLVAEAGGWPAPGMALDAETLEMKRRNDERIEATELLIAEGMLDSAEALLGRIQGPVEPGEKDALEGYLRAEQGRCEEAHDLFEAAKAAGKRCIPERYEAACAKGSPC